MNALRIPPPVEPVRNGTADQLARIARFRALEQAQPEELDAVAFFLIGDVGDPIARASLWEEMQTDLLKLWHLITDDWDTEDLDDIPEADWSRYDLGTWQREEDHRYQITRDRLTCDIERALWLGRYAAAEGRRARTAVA